VAALATGAPAASATAAASAASSGVLRDSMGDPFTSESGS
jgi:hypothetical protein